MAMKWLLLLLLSVLFNWPSFPAPDWRCPPGRLRRAWLMQVEEDLGQPVSEAWITAMEQPMCRSVRPSAGHVQQ